LDASKGRDLQCSENLIAQEEKNSLYEIGLDAENRSIAKSIISMF